MRRQSPPGSWKAEVISSVADSSPNRAPRSYMPGDSLYVQHFMSWRPKTTSNCSTLNWNKIRIRIRVRIRVWFAWVRVSFLYSKNYQIEFKLWRHDMNCCTNSDSLYAGATVVRNGRSHGGPRWNYYIWKGYNHHLPNIVISQWPSLTFNYHVPRLLAARAYLPSPGSCSDCLGV